jgi:hypothetical protein
MINVRGYHYWSLSGDSNKGQVSPRGIFALSCLKILERRRHLTSLRRYIAFIANSMYILLRAYGPLAS